MAWDQKLPADFKRAAPEIYRNLRSAGAASARAWLSTHYGGDRQSQIWIDLWNCATQVDFSLARCTDDPSRVALLASDDGVEIALRRLASFVYFQRTRDSDGAQHMLALSAPGAHTDVAPTWLVSESTVHSKNEYQRAERVRAVGRMQQQGGGGQSQTGGGPRGRGQASQRGGGRNGGGKARGRGDGRGGGHGQQTQG